MHDEVKDKNFELELSWIGHGELIAFFLKSRNPCVLLTCLKPCSFYHFALFFNIASGSVINMYIMKEVLYEVRCLKSTEHMILALAGQFKQLSHEPEKFR